MGAWGTAIFSDDTAADVRDDFKDYIGDGLSVEAATDRVLAEWKESINDSDDGPVIWIALAATQWKLGRLSELVREKALAIIHAGSNLKRRDGQDREKRRTVLENLRAQLLSTPPAPKKVPKRFRDHCDWGMGELIAYTTLSGGKVIFRVIGFHEDKGGKAPVCELLDWKGRDIPPEADLERIPIQKGPRSQFMIGRTSEKELPTNRVQRLGIRFKPAQKVGGYVVYLWRHLDRQLNDHGIA